MQRLIAPLVFLLGLSLGTGLPDADRRFGLVHRSIVTHGLLLLLIWWVADRKDHPLLRFFAIGFGIASAIHFSFDLFPRSWIGFALISIPGMGQSNAVFSWCWLAVGIVTGIYLACSFIRRFIEFLMGGAGALLTFSLSAPKEPHFWLPLLALIIALGIVVYLPTPGKAVLQQWWARKPSTHSKKLLRRAV